MRCARMESLERHRGHFYNWYDTQTLLPLAPLYVSTVDSGNLAGHLLTLATRARGALRRPHPQSAMARGLERYVRDSGRRRRRTSRRRRCIRAVRSRRSHRRRPPDPRTLADAWVHVGPTGCVRCRCRRAFHRRPTRGLARAKPASGPRALARQCADLRDELMLLAPWLELRTAPDRPRRPGANGIPTLRELAALDAAWSPDRTRRDDSSLRRARLARHAAAARRAGRGARNGKNGRHRPACAAGDRTCRNGL